MAATGWTCSMSSKIVYVVFLTFLQLNQFNGDVNLELHRRFEYKYSFKPPYLAQKDGTVPFWEYGGSKSRNPHTINSLIFHLFSLVAHRAPNPPCRRERERKSERNFAIQKHEDTSVERIRCRVQSQTWASISVYCLHNIIVITASILFSGCRWK